MGEDSEIRDVLLQKRTVSKASGTVTYDLTSGVDFSEPSVIGSNLSDIVMEKEVSKWVSINSEGMILEPTYSVKIIVAENENDEIEQAVGSFFNNIGSSDGLLSIARGVNMEEERRAPTIPILLIATFMVSMFAFILLAYSLGFVMLLIFNVVIAIFDFFANRNINEQRDYDHTSELLAVLLNHIEVKALDSA